MRASTPLRPICQTAALLALAVLVSACTPKDTVAPDSAQNAPETTSVEPPAYRGATIARQICAQCHDVGVPNAKPIVDVGAPAFASIAKSSETSPSALKDRMSRSHPTMPSYALGDGSFEDISAYIISLREPD